MGLNLNKVVPAARLRISKAQQYEHADTHLKTPEENEFNRQILCCLDYSEPDRHLLTGRAY